MKKKPVVSYSMVHLYLKGKSSSFQSSVVTKNLVTRASLITESLIVIDPPVGGEFTTKEVEEVSV